MKLSSQSELEQEVYSQVNRNARGGSSYDLSKGAPFVPKEVVDWLSICFPDTLPATPISQVELAVKVGQQMVIKMLRAHSNRDLAAELVGTDG